MKMSQTMRMRIITTMTKMARIIIMSQAAKETNNQISISKIFREM